MQERLPEGHRFLIVGNYIAVYRIEEQVVYVIRVVQGSRDMVRLLRGGSHR